MSRKLKVFETILRNHNLIEDNARHYYLTGLQWLIAYVERHPEEGWVKALDHSFLSAATTCLEYFRGTGIAPERVKYQICKQLAEWRNDINDFAGHPLSQLGRYVQGNPGDRLEIAGPLFRLTIDDILEGFAQEFILQEWRDDKRSAKILLGLALACIASIAVAIFWAVDGHGSNLDQELTRLAKARHDRSALRGQLANLIIAGQVISWGHQVAFVAEKDGKRPDWQLSAAARAEESIFVECTSVERAVVTMDDRTSLGAAVASAWNDKKVKFVVGFRPGVISIDISSIPVDRGFGRLFNKAYFSKVKLCLPKGKNRRLMIYDARSDWELMAAESFNRDLLGLLASALHSEIALANQIKGVLIYYGQAVVVDTLHDTIRRPDGGVLAWSGSDHEPTFRLALSLCGPPNTRAPRTPTVFLV